MPALDATVKGASANSYLTVADADVRNGRQLYTEGWDAASTSPSAQGYLVNGALSAGATQMSVDGGTGDMTAGMLFQFVGIGDSTIYTVSKAVPNPVVVQFTPATPGTVADDTPIDRLTANEKEGALILGTFTLDYSFDWEGFKRDIETPQALDHPRSGMFDDNGDFYDFDLIAEPVLAATAYQANVLLERNILQTPELLGQGIREAKLDVMQVKVDTSASSSQLEPVDTFVQTILSEIGRLKPIATRGAKVVPLLRG